MIIACKFLILNIYVIIILIMININEEDYKNEIVRIFIKERKNKIYMHLLKHRDKIKNND